MARRRVASSFDEVVVEHEYPAAFALLREQGPHAVAVLHVLLARAYEDADGVLVTRASVREIAAQIGCLSKDSVHRALRALVHAGVLSVSDTAPSTYVPHLDGSGIAAHAPHLPF